MRLVIIFILTVILTSLGLVNLYSIHQGYSNQFYMQIFAFFLGVLILIFMRFINLKRFMWLAPFAYIVGLITLILIPLGMGKEAFGATRWISLGGFQFQPSEFAKISLILALATLLTKKGNPLLKYFYSILTFGIYGLLVYWQPHLGTSLVLGMIFISMVYFSNLPLKYLVVLSVIFLLVMPFGWFMLEDFQKARLLVFINPGLDPGGLGYNIMQSLITVGSGGFTGKGFMQGTQARLGFLPVPWSDFAFASLMEQGGFMLGLFIIFSFMIIFGLTLSLISASLTPQGVLLIAGVLGMWGFETLINIGMNMGIAPVVGIPLPFISYGGSAMIKNYLALGLLITACSKKENRGLWFNSKM
ncbi:MAG: Peptidoglycan glycosyltransferase MrdB [candidate division WS2 bacterium]|uniref:Peptidoglycan glycosyltransferase MrdB n=1 Tax=Psychracetigena formicireducens TaxID=2986056 RepID=A0A9E2BGS2_PSYF1|nr:Peptidoglycan glycosyltransferase MrdB [Candidatus Psychracetigena formicireducens]MBT9144276.1 Peptidoglycan glycosyltransferase MrdB [Candidatus Psychracetigena formicireducens]MBT9149920.1 Peptidoglycan glycosyltransferase MrdB [Candidatus Psychracetigena formicireducens]